jgi:cytochrome c biogenesis protein CcmG/thiol:disulfide interchange protein DsbE
MILSSLRYLLPLLLFGVLAAYFAAGLSRDPHLIPSALIDKPAPAFDLPPLPGFSHGVRSADLAIGRPQLLNVFASWCVPCRAEQPVLLRLAREQGVMMRGLNYKDKPEDAVAWLAGQGNPFESIGADRDGRVGIDFGVYGVPETFVIDGAGRIRFKHVGPLSPDDVERIVLPLLRTLGR